MLGLWVLDSKTPLTEKNVLYYWYFDIQQIEEMKKKNRSWFLIGYTFLDASSGLERLLYDGVRDKVTMGTIIQRVQSQNLHH